MGLFGKKYDYTKPDPVNNPPDETFELSIDHKDGESWSFDFNKHEQPAVLDKIEQLSSGKIESATFIETDGSVLILSKEMVKQSIVEIYY
jgi:hypothetical protein